MARHAPGTQDVLAQGLGWFSIGLGLAELLAPQRLARALDMSEHADLIRAYGAREIITGVGILTQDRPAGWMWGRVAGDAIDLGTLAAGLVGPNRRKKNVAVAMAAVAGITALDIYCAANLGAEQINTREQRASFAQQYRSRSGWPLPASEMRGAASDFDVPADMRIPDAMRPYAA